MNDNVLLMEKENGVVTLTLNRPEVMNSFNFAMLHALRDQIDSIRFKPDIRVVIITAAGEKAFCAGADLKERATLPPDKVKEYIFTIRNLFTSIEQLNKAVIAAVNGIALGGGTELALACDIRIASTNATKAPVMDAVRVPPSACSTSQSSQMVRGPSASRSTARGCGGCPA